MATVYMGIGSNLGSRRDNCLESLRRINALAGVEVRECSSFYETIPVGGPPQPVYLNGVARIETDIAPFALLKSFKEIEKEMGREDTGSKNQPRVIDLDILLYGDLVIKSREITVPHPEMHRRYFVLKGLAEISPDVTHPVIKKTALELLKLAICPEDAFQTRRGTGK